MDQVNAGTQSDVGREPRSFMKLDVRTGYFTTGSANVIVFDDIYAPGHQSGITVLMRDRRVAANGDLRFEQTPAASFPGSRITSA